MVKITKEQILQKIIILNSGVKIPQFGVGTYLMVDNKSIYNAEYYKNEEIIGNVMKNLLEENKGVKREYLFITFKIWNENHKYELPKDAFHGILTRLKPDYLDLCLIHWPTKKSFECWRVLEEFYKSRKVRAIRISNFNSSQLKYFVKKIKIKPVINQLEPHAGFNQIDIIHFCSKNDIAINLWRTILSGKGYEIPLLQELANKYHILLVKLF